jgi:AraC-like DNA-binding protein
MRKQKMTPARGAELLKIEQRRAEVAKLRVKAWTLKEIADHFGVSIGLIHSDLVAVTARTKGQANEAIQIERAMSLARNDVATKAIMGSVETGDVAAIDRLVKLDDRRAKILGLDAPQRGELSGPGGGPLEVEVNPATAARLVREAFGERASQAAPEESAHDETEIDADHDEAPEATDDAE